MTSTDLTRRSALMAIAAAPAALAVPAAANTMTAQERATHHLELAREALNEIAPGRWRVSTNLDNAFALIIRDNDGPLLAEDAGAHDYAHVHGLP